MLSRFEHRTVGGARYFIYMPSIEPVPIVWQKRAFDVCLGSVFLVLTLPLFVLFFSLLVIEHILRGRPFDPLLYSEQRVSRGKLFTLYKFNIFDQRTIDSLRAQNQFIHTKKLEHSRQLILVGTLLKQIYLDELPQLFNVLSGNMSLVGPRPLNREVFASISQKIIPTVARIQGGMTGSYQSHKNTRGKSAAELDALYLEHYTHRSGWVLVAIDIKILLRTLKVLLRAKGV